VRCYRADNKKSYLKDDAEAILLHFAAGQRTHVSIRHENKIQALIIALASTHSEPHHPLFKNSTINHHAFIFVYVFLSFPPPLFPMPQPLRLAHTGRKKEEKQTFFSSLPRDKER
jgi:hypothetical protein